jgi:DNA-binding MarR family transcriptional regulator
VTRSQWWVLAYLSRKDGMTQSELAEELDLGKVAIGGLIARLEKSGFVRRAADARDGRINRVFLDPKGKQLVAKLRKISHQFNQQILTGLSNTKLESTAATLEAMKKNLLAFLNDTDTG